MAINVNFTHRKFPYIDNRSGLKVQVLIEEKRPKNSKNAGPVRIRNRGEKPKHDRYNNSGTEL